MKTEIIIKRFKENIKGLIADLPLFEKTKGQQGSQCLNADKLYEMLHWTDEQIIDYEENEMGYYLIDKEQYLEKIKKEKTD